jgi:hypothetical protein
MRVAIHFGVWLCLLSGQLLKASEFQFDGAMPESVLRNYLSRAMTQMYLLTGHGDLESNTHS